MVYLFQEGTAFYSDAFHILLYYARICSAGEGNTPLERSTYGFIRRSLSLLQEQNFALGLMAAGGLNVTQWRGIGARNGARFFLVVGLLGLTSLFASAQSPPVMAFLPLIDKGIDMTKPKGVSQMISLRKSYNALGSAFDVDTNSIVDFDSLGRTIKFVSFDNHKRGTTYIKEYPDQYTEIMWNAYKARGYDSSKSLSRFKYNEAGQRIAAQSVQVLNGVETMLNEHVYEYDKKGQLTYQCDLCNLASGYQYKMIYEDTLLLSIEQFRGDTTALIERNDFTYDDTGHLRHFIYRRLWGGAETIDQERSYVYDANRIVGATEKYAFENGAVRNFKYGYNESGQLISKHASIGERSMVTSFRYEGDRLVESNCTTNFPLNTSVSVWFSASAKSYGPAKETNIKTQWVYDQLGNPVLKSIWVDGVIAMEWIQEMKYD